MADMELIEKVGKYIDKYYEPGTDDIKKDEEMDCCKYCFLLLAA